MSLILFPNNLPNNKDQILISNKAEPPFPAILQQFPTKNPTKVLKFDWPPPTPIPIPFLLNFQISELVQSQLKYPPFSPQQKNFYTEKLRPQGPDPKTVNYLFIKIFWCKCKLTKPVYIRSSNASS